jgi:hypothetical protein
MAIDLGRALPVPLHQRLVDNAGRAADDVAVPICTVDDMGFPHAAMLSYAEVSAVDSAALRARVYSSSRTARHLRRDGRATLLFVDPAGIWYVKVVVDGEEATDPGAPGAIVFPLRVYAVIADDVDRSREPAAVIVSGIRFRRTEGPSASP